jgi:MFS family permease
MRTSPAALREWRSGWPLVLVNCVGIVGAIMPTYSLGMFMKPLAAQFNWSRAELSTPLLFMAFATLFASGFGTLVDRLGPRRIILVGVPLTGIALAGVGLCGPSIWTWYAAWLVFAFVELSLGAMTWIPAVARHFNVSRGLALAVGTTGSGIGAALWPPLVLFLINTIGWRWTFAAIGGAIGLGVTVLAFFLFRGPATGPAAALREQTDTSQLEGLTLRQTLRTTLFWRIALVLMVTAAAVSSISVHLPVLLTDKGLTPGQAARIVATLGPALIVGRLAAGYLLDRLSARQVSFSFLLMPAVSCALLVGFDGSFMRGVLATVLVGVAAGVEGDLLAYLLSRYFGLRHFGAIYGAGLTIFAIGYGAAPVAGGAIFDHLGSYDLGFGILAGLLVPCAIVALSFGPYRGERPPPITGSGSVGQTAM